MAVSLSEIPKLASDHPLVTAGVVFGGGLALLWLFGFFSSSSGSSDTTGGLGAAYFAAEAQQATVGGQIQMTTLQTAADVNKAGIASRTAIALGHIQAGAATMINGQNTTTAQNIVGLQTQGAVNLAGVQGQSAEGLAFTQGQAAANLAGVQAQGAEGLAFTQGQTALGITGLQANTVIHGQDVGAVTAGIAADVAKTQAATGLAMTVSNNAAAVATNEANNREALAHQQAAIAAQAGVDYFNFVQSANTGFRTLFPATSGGGTG